MAFGGAKPKITKKPKAGKKGGGGGKIRTKVKGGAKHAELMKDPASRTYAAAHPYAGAGRSF